MTTQLSGDYISISSDPLAKNPHGAGYWTFYDQPAIRLEGNRYLVFIWLTDADTDERLPFSMIVCKDNPLHLVGQ